MAYPDAKRQPTPTDGAGCAAKTMSTNDSRRSCETGTDSIVPEGFNLEAARQAKSTTPDKEITRCPRCESASIRHRSDSIRNERELEAAYRCKICDNRFDYPEVGGE